MDFRLLERAFLIRTFEERLLELFAQGRLAGTVHTCIGQELGAVAVGMQLRRTDWIFSNHRCHGHYLAVNPEVKGLLAEILGHPSGICGGRGGSQHVCNGRFFSNGVQGGGLPIAAGCALVERMSAGSDSIAVAFIGDGTLGQGVLYESLNLAAKWELPWLVVLEHNGYAQSTSAVANIAGDIGARFEAFGWRSYSADIWDATRLTEISAECVAHVRRSRKPAVLIIQSYRLKAHSKGDDNRDPSEVASFLAKDPLVVFEARDPDRARDMRFGAQKTLADAELRIGSAAQSDFLPRSSHALPEGVVNWGPVAGPMGSRRVAEVLRDALGRRLEEDERVLLIGEDVEDNYGGAFKVTKGLSTRFPGRVRNTPISEAAIAGVGNGLAIAGRLPIVEIMFGDFVTLIADQIINQAAKFPFIYNEQVKVPVIYRTPMGGRRGYGATHSQSLEKIFFGTPGLRIVAVNEFIDPLPLLRSVQSADQPCLWLENKALYGVVARAGGSESVDGWLSNGLDFPTLRLAVGGGGDVTLVAYGGMAGEVVRAAKEVFVEQEIRCDVVVPVQLQPLDVRPILESAARTGRLVIVEEGQAFAGFGAEVITRCVESMGGAGLKVRRCGPAEHPIPCAREQEILSLPQVADIVEAVQEVLAP